jgi:hypothetical protein
MQDLTGELLKEEYQQGYQNALKELREKLPQRYYGDTDKDTSPLDQDFVSGKQYGWNRAISEIIRIIKKL